MTPNWERDREKKRNKNNRQMKCEDILKSQKPLSIERDVMCT